MTRASNAGSGREAHGKENPRRASAAGLLRAQHALLVRGSSRRIHSSRGPLYCDHSVTSADVRLSVGPTNRSKSEEDSLRILVRMTDLVLGRTPRRSLSSLRSQYATPSVHAM